MHGCKNFTVFTCCCFCLLFLSSNFKNVNSLSTDQACELCQSVLTHVYYTYLQQSTRKLVKHRILNNCKRYANYKRRCILTLRPKASLIFENMRSSAIGEYRAYKTCVLLKECSNFNSRTSVKDSMPDFIIEQILNGTASEQIHLKGDIYDPAIDEKKLEKIE
jgi:hypothetical protein|uniref:Saposin B-type domain-containing protein n=1 Tax=Panagrolaimus sp. PS1159 TaxID=55785 RepID=A0AC35GVR2_9BILA